MAYLATVLSLHILSPASNLKKILMCLYFWEREKARAGEGQRERETEDPKRAKHWQQRAPGEARTHRSWDRDLSRSRRLNRPSHPGGPLYKIFVLRSILGLGSKYSKPALYRVEAGCKFQTSWNAAAQLKKFCGWAVSSGDLSKVIFSYATKAELVCKRSNILNTVLLEGSSKSLQVPPSWDLFILQNKSKRQSSVGI